MPTFECRLARFGRRLKKLALRGRSKSSKAKNPDCTAPSTAFSDSSASSPTSSLSPSLDLYVSLPPSPPPSPSPSVASSCRCRKEPEDAVFVEPEQSTCPLFDIIGVVNPESKMSHQENPNLPILLLILVVSCRQPSRLRLAARKEQSEDSHLAQAGFWREDGASVACCVVCEEEAQSTGLTINALMALHHGACAFRDLWTMLHSSQNWSDTIRTDLFPLLRHLQAELNSSKATVAKEMRFSLDQVAMEMTHRFIASVSPFPDAGTLVDALIQRWVFTEAEDQWIVVDGICDFLLSLDATPPPPVQIQRPVKAPSLPVQPRPVVRTMSGRERLLRETQMLLQMSRCRACGEEEAIYLCLPCAHVSVCGSCVPRIIQCPRCDNRVDSLVRTYHA